MRLHNLNHVPPPLLAHVAVLPTFDFLCFHCPFGYGSPDFAIREKLFPKFPFLGLLCFSCSTLSVLPVLMHVYSHYLRQPLPWMTYQRCYRSNTARCTNRAVYETRNGHTKGHWREISVGLTFPCGSSLPFMQVSHKCDLAGAPSVTAKASHNLHDRFFLWFSLFYYHRRTAWLSAVHVSVPSWK